jgi:glyoxylase-like metal-dependent hydrolase (beta-lactamase superfamily II)
MRRPFLPAAIAALTLLPLTHALTAQSPAPVVYDRLVPGFLPESFGDDGMAKGNGFATANPWGAYTAYLLSTNAKGQRTWRIEDYLPNAGGATAQGSTMYLFEGQERALLVDTAQNTADVPGQNDLKTVVRHLLGHTNDGGVRQNPVDFVVANTHSHGDHTGKNSLMSDRTVYYPDLDWPRTTAPANYVPIKEGGGATSHGATGQAASQIDLGGRTLVAIDIHAHTPGSTGYLDRENRMIATGDAIGSAYVWAHFGLVTLYAESVHHLQDVLRSFDRVDVLPAHFYQIKQGARGKPPISGRPLDKSYVDDQVRVADGILAGTVIGEPYRSVGRNTAIATIDSASVVYTLANLYPGGFFASTGDRTKYHAIAIPGEAPPASGGRFNGADSIKGELYLIRDYANETMFLLVGSSRALLIGTGSGTPGLAAFVAPLAHGRPLDVVVTSDDPGQIGGLGQFARNRIYLPAGVTAPQGLGSMERVAPGGRLDLGTDRAGRPLILEVHPLAGHSPTGITLLDVNDRALFGGDALGTQDADNGLLLHSSLAAFAQALTAWRSATDGRYDVVYTAHNYQWFTSPAYVDQLQEAVSKGLNNGDAAWIESPRLPGSKSIRSTGAADIVASVLVVPASGGR